MCKYVKNRGRLCGENTEHLQPVVGGGYLAGMIDARREASEAARIFGEVKFEVDDDQIRSLAEGLEHLAKAVQAIADPEMAKLSMDW